MIRVSRAFDFARSPEGVILSTVEGRSANDGHVRYVTYAGRSANDKTPNVLRQAQDDLLQGFVESDLNKQGCLCYTTTEDSYPVGEDKC